MAERLGLDPIETISPELQYGIESLLPSQHFVKLSQLLQKQVGAARLVIGEVSYRIDTSGSGSTQTVKQSLAYFEQPGLGLPALVVQPSGIRSQFFSTLSGLMGISSVDLGARPAASRLFEARSMQPQSSQQLLSGNVLDVLCARKDLTLKTNEDRILLYRSGHIFEDAEFTEFVDDARTTFQAIHRRAIELPHLCADAQAEAVATIRTMGGPVGAALRKRFVSQAEIDEFLSQSIPRRSPQSLRRQRVGLGSVVFYVMGVALIGIGGGLLWSLASMPDLPKWGLALIGLLPGLGLTTLVLTFLYRRAQKRLLRQGTCHEATVRGVQATSVFVNRQRRYKVTLRIDDEKGSREVTINAYEPAVKQAFRLKSSGQSTRVLVDPIKPDRVFWIDSLAVL